LEQAYSFEFAGSTFSSLQALTYTIQSDLSWLQIDSAQRNVHGNVPANQQTGSFPVTVLASDGSGTTASSQFNVLVVNANNDIVSTGDPSEFLLNQTVPSNGEKGLLTIPGKSFEIVFPKSVFSETNQSVSENDLFYYATSGDKTPLPSWITFGSTGLLSFFGTPPKVYSTVAPPQVFPLRLVASRYSGFECATFDFNIVLGLQEFYFTQNFLDVSVSEGKTVQASLPPLRLSDKNIQYGDSNIVSLSLSGPSWLKLDQSTGRLTGTAQGNVQTTNIVCNVTAQDRFQDIATMEILLDYNNASTSQNSVPDLFSVRSLPTLSTSVGEVVNYTLNSSIFTEQGLELHAAYTPSNVSNWLFFDPSTATFQGIVPKSFNNTSFLVNITAITSDHERVSSLAFAGEVEGIADPSTTVLPSIPSSTHSASSSSSAASSSGDFAGNSKTVRNALLITLFGLLLLILVLLLILYLCVRRREQHKKQTMQKTGGVLTKNAISRPLPEEPKISTSRTPSPDKEPIEMKEKSKKPGRLTIVATKFFPGNSRQKQSVSEGRYMEDGPAGSHDTNWTEQVLRGIDFPDPLEIRPVGTSIKSFCESPVSTRSKVVTFPVVPSSLHNKSSVSLTNSNSPNESNIEERQFSVPEEDYDYDFRHLGAPRTPLTPESPYSDPSSFLLSSAPQGISHSFVNGGTIYSAESPLSVGFSPLPTIRMLGRTSVDGPWSSTAGSSPDQQRNMSKGSGNWHTIAASKNSSTDAIVERPRNPIAKNTMQQPKDKTVFEIVTDSGFQTPKGSLSMHSSMKSISSTRAWSDDEPMPTDIFHQLDRETINNRHGQDLNSRNNHKFLGDRVKNVMNQNNHQQTSSNSNTKKPPMFDHNYENITNTNPFVREPSYVIGENEECLDEFIDQQGQRVWSKRHTGRADSEIISRRSSSSWTSTWGGTSFWLDSNKPITRSSSSNTAATHYNYPSSSSPNTTTVLDMSSPMRNLPGTTKTLTAGSISNKNSNVVKNARASPIRMTMIGGNEEQRRQQPQQQPKQQMKPKLVDFKNKKRPVSVLEDENGDIFDENGNNFVDTRRRSKSIVPPVEYAI